MSRIAYRARALGPLRAIDWAIPAGVSVVVGPNRVGKSTLLRLPELLKLMLERGLNEALKVVFEGVPHLRNLSVPPSVPMTLGLALGPWDWEIDLTMRAGQAPEFPSERLSLDGDPVLWRKFGGKEIEGEAFRLSTHAGLLVSLGFARMKATIDGRESIDEPSAPAGQDPLQTWRKYLPAGSPDLVVYALGCLVEAYLLTTNTLSFRTYHYRIDHIFRYGSLGSSALELSSTGENVFALLRNWRDSTKLEERYEFVLATMREIFPHFGRVGFEQAGQVVTMNVSDRRWPGDASIPIARESTGFTTALLQLCALASCPRHGLVTLDEIETSLHPRAIRILVEACRRWAAAHDLRVVLATQSETVLDQFRDEPSQVFVLEPNQDTSPKPLTELFTPEYLSQFSLGDLFAHLEFGGDTTDDPAP